MTEQQIPKLAGVIVEHQRYFTALPNEDAQWAILNTAAAIGLCVEAIKNRTKTTTTKLLEFITPVKVIAVKKFVAADHFKAGQVVDGVKYYSSFGNDFNEHFLPKVEENVEATELRVHKLLRNSRDLDIRPEIGEDKEETSLAHLHRLLRLQGDGQEGTLLTNGYWNIFYIRDKKGNPWAVSAGWYGDGWYLYAYSVEYPDDWVAGNQVFSR